MASSDGEAVLAVFPAHCDYSLNLSSSVQESDLGLLSGADAEELARWPPHTGHSRGHGSPARHPEINTHPPAATATAHAQSAEGWKEAYDTGVGLIVAAFVDPITRLDGVAAADRGSAHVFGVVWRLTTPQLQSAARAPRGTDCTHTCTHIHTPRHPTMSAVYGAMDARVQMLTLAASKLTETLPPPGLPSLRLASPLSAWGPHSLRSLSDLCTDAEVSLAGPSSAVMSSASLGDIGRGDKWRGESDKRVGVPPPPARVRHVFPDNHNCVQKALIKFR
uniref:Uncharacterized protein n=1 Tax=Knipowitschia caucasica TaxID=637954 RepID=A0AAV2LCK6_KNICA